MLALNVYIVIASFYQLHRILWYQKNERRPLPGLFPFKYRNYIWYLIFNRMGSHYGTRCHKGRTSLRLLRPCLRLETNSSMNSSRESQRIRLITIFSKIRTQLLSLFSECSINQLLNPFIKTKS